VDEERAADVVDHLQAAAVELIEAARGFLDVLEELVGDRDRITEAVEVVGEAVTMATRLVGGHEDEAPERERDPVQRIPVS
jgi:hypothetical protein